MTEPKWTQGEWRAVVSVEDNDDGDKVPVAIVLCGDVLIASVEYPIRDPDELAANAKLLAAAPDLYDALEALVYVVSEFADQPDVIKVQLEEARAALCKARGEEVKAE